MNRIYTVLRKWIDFCEKNHTVPGISFFKKDGDKILDCYAFQLFSNYGWTVGATMGGIGTLDIPVELAVNCLRYDKKKLDNDLKKLQTINNKIESVLGDVPITKELKDVLESIQEGVDKYKYLKAATPTGEIKELVDNNG